MVCSLVYAYFLSKVRLLANRSSRRPLGGAERDRLGQTVQGETPALPLLNIRRSELPLRSDNVALLRLTGLPPDLLLFREQLDLQALHRAGRLRLTLVDHNLLPR